MSNFRVQVRPLPFHLCLLAASGLLAALGSPGATAGGSDQSGAQPGAGPAVSEPARNRHFATRARPIVELLAGNWSISWLDSKGHVIGTGEESWMIAAGETTFVEENRSTVNGDKADEYAAMWWDDKAGRVHGIWCDDSINDEGCSGFEVTIDDTHVILNGEWEFQGKRQHWREVFSFTAGALTQSLYIGDPGAELKLAGVIRGTRR